MSLSHVVSREANASLAKLMLRLTGAAKQPERGALGLVPVTPCPWWTVTVSAASCMKCVHSASARECTMRRAVPPLLRFTPTLTVAGVGVSRAGLESPALMTGGF
ncbi:hypothetical protein E2C01_037249 [Portunus trituberculatus]|uniref:Uncharacterized protein n=1 Tax=Portunus trituberculatus TaxID=210409 RepID=A0A5B7F7M6_PORTR|nr:hypothetical protein [Portunus trituberculatus]